MTLCRRCSIRNDALNMTREVPGTAPNNTDLDSELQLLLAGNVGERGHRICQEDSCTWPAEYVAKFDDPEAWDIECCLIHSGALSELALIEPL